MREADVSPKSFICPSGDESEYDGSNTKDLDIVQLWDFGGGTEPTDGYAYEHVSYAYQMPYADGGGKSSYAADGTSNASFAAMADKNPCFDPKISNWATGNAETWQDSVSRMAVYYTTNAKLSESSWEIKIANAYPHGRDGQNVAFADGHASFEKTTDVGVKNDAIYVPYGGGGTDEDKYRRGALGLMSAGLEHDDTIQPRNSGDSFLVNDDVFDGSKHPQ